MREIKFRAWLDYGDGSGEMLPNIQNHINGKWAFGHIANGSVDGVSQPMQYTGLKDKNGVEIYEGDICEVMYYTPFGDKTDNYYGKWIVTEWMGQFVMVSGKERVSFTDFADVVSSEYIPNLGTVCELSVKVNANVIGNIHQNPELLD
ncbi:YopX protein [Vibrio phage PVA1]|uniref:YopX protein n=1 Tax=Vibrio phage PVA1 TaxID=1461743 RepID=UPI0003F20027|nr:YopX protein [Vibrio phage PVA1]AHJ87873.1 YopX protein [Vibrio phage PVA1]